MHGIICIIDELGSQGTVQPELDFAEAPAPSIQFPIVPVAS
jgi:hypothetical protein